MSFDNLLNLFNIFGTTYHHNMALTVGVVIFALYGKYYYGNEV